MYTIKFNEVMGFYPQNNEPVYQMLTEAVKSEVGVVPFVGAGLSVPFGIKQWSDVLTAAMHSVFKQETRDEIQKLIDQKLLIEAAQKIHSSYGLFLDVLPDLLGTPNLSNERLYRSAAYLLPWLFPNKPVITTNFDSVLEDVYTKNGSPFSTILQPNDIARLTQVRQNNLRTLLKLHGSVVKPVDLRTLVFTAKQYQEAYGENG